MFSVGHLSCLVQDNPLCLVQETLYVKCRKPFMFSAGHPVCLVQDTLYVLCRAPFMFSYRCQHEHRHLINQCQTNGHDQL